MTRLPSMGGNLSAYRGRRIDGSYVHIYRKLTVAASLFMPRVFLQGPRYWRFCRDSQPDPDRWTPNVYDFTDDVRELVCERIRFDVAAMWSDPRERLR